MPTNGYAERWWNWQRMIPLKSNKRVASPRLKSTERGDSVFMHHAEYESYRARHAGLAPIAVRNKS